MRTLYVVLGLSALAVPAVVFAARHRQAPAATAPTPVDPAQGGVALGAEPELVASPGTGVMEPPQPTAGLGKLIQTVGGLVGGATVGATIGAGLTVAQLQGLAVGLAGGNEAQVNSARVFGPAATAAALAQRGTVALGDALGISEGATRTASQGAAAATAAGMVFGGTAAVGVAISKGVGELASAAIGAVLGEGTERAIRSTLSELDPFKSGSFASDVVGGIAEGIFGGWGGGTVFIDGGRSIADQKRAAAADLARANTLDRKNRGGARDEV